MAVTAATLRIERDAAHMEVAELREQIAREIEAAPEHHIEDGPMSTYYAAIARGTA